MSVTSQTDKTGPFLITGLPQVIPVGFPFQSGSDLLALNAGSAGTPIDPANTLALGSDYTVTGGGYDAFNQMQTGSILVVAGGANSVTVGQFIVIMRNVPINQTSTFLATGPLTMQQVEQALDKSATLDQQVNEITTRSLRFEKSEFLDGTLLKSARANNLLGFDAAGVPAFFGIPGTTGGAFGAGYGLTLASNIFSTDQTKIASIAVNIAALKALVVTNFTTGSQVMVAGYYAVGDGGGGVFTYNSGSSATDNGGTIIQPTVGAGRWLRASPNTQLNARQFGAKGDGATNDTTPIATALALAVATTGASLYFPPGTYITDTMSFTGANGLTLYGDGMGVSVLKGRAATRVLVADTSTHVNVHHLTFNGNCTTRTAGQQCVTWNCSQSSFCDNEITKSGEFAFWGGTGAGTVTELLIQRNYIHDTYADGITLANVIYGTVANNLIFNVDDDCIALAYNGAFFPAQIQVFGNLCHARNDLGTTTGRGIYIARAQNILVQANVIVQAKQTGIYVTNDGGTRNASIRIVGNLVLFAAIVSGYPIAVYGTTDCFVLDNVVDGTQPAVNSMIDIADWQNLTVSGGSLTKRTAGACRGIHADEAATWAASWDGLKIMNVAISLLDASHLEGIYLVPNAASTMNKVVISGCVIDQVDAGNYITLSVARTGTLGKVVNNTKMQAANTISPAASVGVITIANNN